ncbi:uncharacterized protein FFMR_03866 [Fusarium fujikuroi]|nr:uncharacterized protein FFMR_03866 [Fusarium fujikuroi]
MAPNLFIQLIP